jgi:signal transduction histidine kinase
MAGMWARLRRLRWARLSRFAGWMAFGVCLSVAALARLGYRGVEEWRRTSARLMDRRQGDAADMFAKALARDMRGVESAVLSSDSWRAAMLETPYDIRSLVAGAYARYPYPETFFGWRGAPGASSIVFFNRSDRRPAWCTHKTDGGSFPVTIDHEPEIAALIAQRVTEDARRGAPFSIFESTIDGSPHQVIIALRYTDAFADRLDSGFGFAVDLAWARSEYIPQIARQVWTLTGTGEAPSLGVSVLDERGESVVHIQTKPEERDAVRRSFSLLFADPATVPGASPADLPLRTWAVEVSRGAGDAGTTDLSAAANQLVAAAAVTAVLLVGGLAFASRAAMANARLAELRSDFVSSITHELKTPLATIRAASDAVASGRVSGEGNVRDYAQVTAQEAKRLTRLVDNVLAYARITDVTEAYHFEVLELEPLVDDAIQRFEAQLMHEEFEVMVGIPQTLPMVRADRTAFGLLLDNLIDNAIRYSRYQRLLVILARDGGQGFVVVDVTDTGAGIPTAELDLVWRKFFRGRHSGWGGSGLGLAIVSRIVADHGGTLHLDSVEKRGTTVSFTLPIARGEA